MTVYASFVTFSWQGNIIFLHLKPNFWSFVLCFQVHIYSPYAWSLQNAGMWIFFFSAYSNGLIKDVHANRTFSFACSILQGVLHQKKKKIINVSQSISQVSKQKLESLMTIWNSSILRSLVSRFFYSCPPPPPPPPPALTHTAHPPPWGLLTGEVQKIWLAKYNILFCCVTTSILQL